MNKLNRGDYGAVPKSNPKSAPTSAKGVQMKGPSISKSYARNPSPPKETYRTTTSSTPDKNNVDGTGEGVVKYNSTVKKG